MGSVLAERKLYELFIPSMLMCMTGNLTAICDSVFIANFVNLNALSAIQLLMPLISVIAVLEWIFGLGGQIISLNKKSEFDEHGSNYYYTLSIISVIIFSTLFSIFCFLFMDNVLVFLEGTSESLPYMAQYLPILLIDIPITCFVSIITQFIRVDGQAKFATLILVVATLVNVILDFIFLEYFHMGVPGAALASLIGYIVASLIVFKYFFDKKRTFRFINIFHSFKSLVSRFLKIVKVGLPGACSELAFVLLAYVMNIIIANSLSDPGLAIFTMCDDAFLIISIVLIGFVESLSSLVPVYYSQEDYANIKFLVKRSFIIMFICSCVFTLFLWLSPDTFLSLYSVKPNNVEFEYILRLFSLSFIFQVATTIFIFYYESIERTFISTTVAFINILFGPIVFTIGLLPIIGTDAIWLSFSLACLLALLAVYVYILYVNRKEKDYSGFLIIKEDVLENSKNYEINTKNKDQLTDEIFTYIESLGVYEKSYKMFKDLLNEIFANNNDKVLVEVLLIKYDDKLKINIKDNGVENIIGKMGEEFKDNFKYNKVLGLNSLESTINI